jgi:hypothetical protein
MTLKHANVYGLVVLCMILLGSGSIQAQEARTPISQPAANGPNRSLEKRVALLEKLLVAERAARQAADTALRNSVTAETAARKAADTMLQNSISPSGGVTQAAVDAAVAAEAALRASADTALEGQIAIEKADRIAADSTIEESTESVASLLPLATYLTIEANPINGLPGPHMIFTGVNLHIRSGHASRSSVDANGRGNLIVGYNEVPNYSSPIRGGSHNVVVGPHHNYNFGAGLVLGYENHLGGSGASIVGGAFNSATGAYSTIVSGRSNIANGPYSSVSGGETNRASGAHAVVSGGSRNKATGDYSVVSGGSSNEASGNHSTIGGGVNTTNSTADTFVP